MRLPLWLKLSFIVTCIFIVALWAILQSTNDIFYQDKRNFLVEMSSKINTSIVRVFNERITNTKKKLAIFTTNYESLSESKKKHPDLDQVIFSQYPEFLSIGLVNIGDKMELDWLRINPSSGLEEWSKSYIDKLVLNYSSNIDNSLVIHPFLGPDNSRYFLFTFPVELKETQKKVRILAIMDRNLFTDLLSDYKATLNLVFISDESGTIVAHPFSDQVGESYKKHPLIQEVAAGKKQGVGDSYTNLDGEEIVASFQNIGGTNLYAYTTTPKKEAFSAADELWRNLFVIACGVLFLGIVISLLFTRVITNPLKRLKEIASEIGSGKFNVAVDVKSNDEVGQLAGSIQKMAKDLVEREEALEHSKKALVQSEKMSAFGQLSAGIAHEVKNPLAGILGHAQLAKSKSKEAEVLKHVGMIEKETRRTKEIIDNLMKFSRAEKLELVPTNLYDTVHSAVDLVDHQLSLDGIKIFKHIERVSPVLGHSNQIQQVLLNLMMNAGHAMEDSEVKELHVYLKESDKGTAQIRLQDSGKGMPKDVQERVFEPFFTTKPAGKGTGLGLSVSVGIIKDHNGEISVESELEKGTTFIIDIPINNEVDLPVSTRAEQEIEQDNLNDIIQDSEKDIDSSIEEQSVDKIERDSLPKEESEIKVEKDVEEDSVNFPESPEGSDLLEKKPLMHSSRDYLMSEEDKSIVSKNNKSNKSRKKNKDHKKSNEKKINDYKVKIRKPKVGKS